MAKQLEYDPNAILYRWIYKEDDGNVRLIGTDPALKDTTKFFRWIDEPHGWEQREPWSQGTVNATAIQHKIGARSGWTGAIPLPSRPVGRPRKEVAEEDRPVSVSTSMRRAELFEIMRRAGEEKMTVSEWVAGVLRDRLAGAAERPVHAE
jgi:hypothetical protein